MIRLLIFICLVFEFQSCAVDSAQGYTFLVENDIDAQLTLKFYHIYNPAFQKADTTVLLSSGKKFLFGTIVGTGSVQDFLPVDKYGNILLFDSLVVIRNSDDKRSADKFTNKSDWQYAQANSHSASYTLQITSADF
ncbi:MAG: hypothetical protein QM734_16665 [Cyclobacteriaceae bacterium]